MRFIQQLKRYRPAAIVLLTVLLIGFFYPGNVKFKYDFQKGQTWRYEDLIAPFDFPILKSDEELERDRDQITSDFSPYYRLNPDLQSAKLKDFEAESEQVLSQLQSGNGNESGAQEFLKESKEFLNKIYQRGIIKLAPDHQEKGADFVINLAIDNTIQKRTLSSFYTQEQAKHLLTGSDSELKVPGALEKIVLAALVPNIAYDEALTERLKAEALNSVSTTKGVVWQGETIVKKGAVTTDEVFQKLSSYRQKFENDISAKKSSWAVYFGYLLLTGLIVGAFMMYVNSYRREIIQNLNYLIFVMMWLLIFSYLTYLVVRMNGMSIYVIPFCIVPIVVRHFFTYRLAFFTHVVVVLIAGFLAQEGFQFAFTQIVAGVISVLAIADARNWSVFFRSVMFIVLAYALSHLGLSLIEEGNLNLSNWRNYGWFLLNGLFILLAFPLIPLAERVFGFTSSISLVELTDINRPLLRQLAIKAPGTLQHSLQVGNLAEAAAQAIGADPLLVRAGALYHDIGKMQNPEFFIENQGGKNPHQGKTPLESARIIIRHVPDGEQLAKKSGLPQVVTNFIVTHHGTTRVEYFYKTYLQENPEGESDKKKFTYPGPKPRSKEEAILMLADSVEATSRVLKDPTGEDIDALVDKIVQGKIDHGQLNKCRLTFNELDTCVKVFKKMLRSIYHVRVEYPE